MTIILMIVSWIQHQKTSNKSKSKQVELHHTKSFCTAKEMINRVKKQLIKSENISANHISDKKLIFKIYKELLQFQSKNQKDNSTP